MHASLALLALAAGSQALVSREATCCFGLTANGGPGGSVGQLDDGQNRIGQDGLPTGKFCIDSAGGLTDGQGRGCILTPPSTQFQCDVGATPTPGFSLSCEGLLTYDGTTTFYTCPTGDNGGFNVYSQPLEGEPLCVPITLMADNCASGCVTTSTITAECPSTVAPPPKETVPPSPPPAAPPAPKPTCPADLTGSFEFPHLIVPINHDEPDKAYGTSFNGTSCGSITSLFKFDIPQSYAGKSCTLEFLFPQLDQLETSAFEVSGSPTYEFGALDGTITEETTYANAPPVVHTFGQFDLTPGSATIVAEHPECPAGGSVTFQMTPIGDACLNYFQDYNPCPIGLYITGS